MNSLIIPHKIFVPKIHDNVFVAPNAAVVGDVVIGDGSSVWFGVSIRGDLEGDVKIGERTNIQDNSVVHVRADFEGTFIGNDVTIGHSALLHGCHIEDFAFIGMGATIMDWVTIESFSMVAAGSVVSPKKTIKSGQLWAGAPAKYKRDLTEKEIEHIKWSSSHYAKLAQEYKKEIS